VNNSKTNICVTLPSPIAYSETFLQAHVDRLSAALNYLQDLPIDLEEVFPKGSSSDRTDEFKRRVRVSWHRYILNPRKKISLRKFFKRNNINIVLAEYGLTGIGVFNLCKELNIPLIVHFHGYDAYANEVLGRHEQAYRRMFDYASAIIAVSKHMAEQLVKLGAPAAKVVYNPYGIEIDSFPQATVLASPSRVLSVGRFVEKKAPYLTILAFKKVLDRLPEARLVMVGAGLLHDVCSNLIKALHIEHAVELKGVLEHAGVAALMQESRVFVQHSLVPASGDTEGTPVAILEAGAAGLPVVSTRHAGIMDVVVHGKTGFLVDEGNIDAMSDYMFELLVNPDLASEMGKHAREHISANFTMEQSITNLRRIIERCLVVDANALHELSFNKSVSPRPLGERELLISFRSKEPNRLSS
jgi:colanic acid/amylovoran biosynthesis glycosyltransferase